MYFQMIRVISSPSSSTTGLVTLIFAISLRPFGNSVLKLVGLSAGVIAPPNGPRKPTRLCTFCAALADRSPFLRARLKLHLRGLDGSFVFDPKAESNLIILLEESRWTGNRGRCRGVFETASSKPCSMT